MSRPVLVKLSNVIRSFGKIQALSGVSLELESDQQYVIQGASGSGKSTLLYLLAGLDIPTRGEIWINGQNLSQMNDEELAGFRNRFVGLIFQFHFLLPSMNGIDNILLPARIAGLDLAPIKSEILFLAKRLGVFDVLNKFPYQLSGGEQQRINILRAISLRPKLILCDEPTGDLDSVNSQTVVALLKELAQKYQSTLVIVTHEKDVADAFSNKIFLRDGRLV